MAGYIILGIVLVFAAVIAIRTVRFTPKPQPQLSDEEVTFDKEASLEALRQLVRCRTVSYNDHSLEDDGEFRKLIGLLPQLYPNVFRTCEFRELPDRALLFKWSGKASDEAAVMMAHYDVVPVNEENWEKPPFEAILEDGVLWGRGTLDTKV
ncbi:MAG: M20/M25/M40 family metallo-hydrolase, partial [Clostridia bacterium]|nr:M20/M25/M40 family metallo-hydrolase [Clostridia bacterium]